MNRQLYIDKIKSVEKISKDVEDGYISRKAMKNVKNRVYS